VKRRCKFERTAEDDVRVDTPAIREVGSVLKAPIRTILPRREPLALVPKPVEEELAAGKLIMTESALARGVVRKIPLQSNKGRRRDPRHEEVSKLICGLSGLLQPEVNVPAAFSSHGQSKTERAWLNHLVEVTCSIKPTI